MSASVPSMTTIGGKEDPFPILQDIWSFFAEKGIKVVFVSVGTGKTPLVELEFSEMLGCPVHIFEPNGETAASWDQIKEVLRTRKVEENTSEFVKAASKKWVLPRNIFIQNELPFFHDGTLQVNNKTWTTKDIRTCVKEACGRMNISEDAMHIDVLKISVENEESMVLQAVLSAGFLPSILLIRWTNKPDSDYFAMNAAANLQMIGYELLGKHENNFMYYFNDKNYYELCSWEGVPQQLGKNPLIQEILRNISFESSKNKESS